MPRQRPENPADPPRPRARPRKQAPAATSTHVPTKPARPRPKQLPPWKVLLHNDDVNEMRYVVDTITQLTPLAELEAVSRMREAHSRGVALLLTTHRERAELYVCQFASRNLTVTIEPA